MDSDEGSMSCRSGEERQGENEREIKKENGRTGLARGGSEDIGVVP
jgi:hypothetical protein